MKKLKKLLCIVLAVLTLSLSASASYEPQAINSLNQEYYIMMQNATSDAFLLGSLSAKYESNGNPGTISEGKDTGGVSYGAYQFSSYYGVPLSFAEWCVSSGQGEEIGNRLKRAYLLDGNSYGFWFNSAWENIASEDAQAFLLLQHNYTKAKFYDVVVAKLTANVPGFDISNYTIALKNVIWSRAVQQGVNSDVFYVAFEKIGGVVGKTEEELIRAIYAQSSLVVSEAPAENSVMMTEESAVKYGIDPSAVAGKYLYYYHRNSSDIQVSVYRRLAVRELNDALEMYRQNIGNIGGDDEAVTPPSDEKPTESKGFLVVMLELLLQFIEALISIFTK